jgi:hypothetical protein
VGVRAKVFKTRLRHIVLEVGKFEDVTVRCFSTRSRKDLYLKRPLLPAAKHITANGAPNFIVRLISRKARTVSEKWFKDPAQIAASNRPAGKGSASTLARALRARGCAAER